MQVRLIVVIGIVLFLTACQAPQLPSEPSPGIPAATQAPIRAAATSFAPEVNPLTGLRVADTSLLKVPALLVSISHFPAAARPQSGLSFAPFVYEFYITEGATRFLAVYYGESPKPEVPVKGDCEARIGPFVQDGLMLGRRIWLDANHNGLQDPGEGGISGLCVNLYDGAGKLVQRASTDSNGYYAFNVQPGKYTVEFAKPAGFDFTLANAGDDRTDSDAD